MSRSWMARIVLTAFLLGPFQSQAQNQALVLEGGTLIDGTGGTPINDAIVVIEGSRITKVGTRGQVDYPQGARVIRTEGRTLLPGLIDSHVHLKNFMPPMFLRYGVTTIGDTNNHTEWSLQQKKALSSGEIKGPRLFVTGVAAGGPPEASNNATVPSTTEAFGPYIRPGSDGLAVFGVALKTTEEARAYVRSLLAQDVDMIKVDLTLTLDQLRAVVEEADRAGVPVVGHSQNIEKAVAVGLKYMEHTDTLGRAILEQMGAEQLREGIATPERFMDTSLFDPLIEFMVENGVYLNPTMLSRWRTSTPVGAEVAKAAAALINNDRGLAFVPADVREYWTQASTRSPDSEGYRKTADFLRKYVAAGGKVLAAADTGILPGLSLHYEVQMLTETGIPALQAIQGATLWAAESIGQGKDLGSIEPGKLADITIIEGNPLSDITATRNVRMVIKDGKLQDTAYDRRFVNPIPRPTQ
jgi:imidazolonepropionase-like amidohydrolase